MKDPRVLYEKDLHLMKDHPCFDEICIDGGVLVWESSGYVVRENQIPKDGELSWLKTE